MADIVEYFNWTYVNTVASEGEYGEMGIDAFRQEVRNRNICIAVSEKVPINADAARMDEVVRRLRDKPSARVVVLFLRVEDAAALLTATRRLNETGRFVWIASDGWGKEELPILGGNEVAAEGTLTIELQTTPLTEFDDYFRRLRPATNNRNPWFREYWERAHECSFYDNKSTYQAVAGSSQRRCSGDEIVTPKVHVQESKIQFVFDAVYAFAHALHHMTGEVCGHVRGKRARRRCLRSLDGQELYNNYLLNVSFDDGYGARVFFDENGDSKGRYNIMNFRRNRATRRYEYITVGRWADELRMDVVNYGINRITWAGGTYDIPVSQCSQPCHVGYIKHVQQGDQCCWVCTPCDPGAYVEDEYTCRSCPGGWWPTEDRRGCVRLVEQYMSWDSPFAIIPAALAVIGISATCVVVVAFLQNFDTPVVKASGRELSFMLFAGFIICYLQTFAILAKPGPLVCGIQRFGVGVGFAVTYAALLTKTNRISRIFDSARHSARRPPFISPRSQVAITLLLISVQVIGASVWLILEPPGVRPYHPFGRRDQVVLKCRMKDQWFLLSLVYNMLLIVICTVYAVKTRKIPENFNESKHIGFTMYTTCIIWLAFIPIYFGTLNSFQVQLTTLCVSVTLSATVALVCLFGPKLHIIAFQTDKNVRKLTMDTGAAAGRTAHAKSLSSNASTETAALAAATTSASGSAGRSRFLGSGSFKKRLASNTEPPTFVQMSTDRQNSPIHCGVECAALMNGADVAVQDQDAAVDAVAEQQSIASL